MNTKMSEQHKTIALWIYFAKIPGDDKVAKCKLCSKILSYRTSVTNLKTHLRKRHKREHISFIEKDKIENPRKYLSRITGKDDYDRAVRKKESMNNSFDKAVLMELRPIWKHFSQLADKVARCNYCSKDFSYRTSITNLMTHLRRKHRDCYDSVLKDRSDTNFYSGKLNDGDPLLLIIKPESEQSLPIQQDHYIEEHYIEEHLENHEECVELESEQNQEYYVEVPQQEDTKTQINTLRNIRTRYPVRDKEYKHIDAMLLKLVAKTYQSFSIIEEPNFVEFVKALNPNYKLPNHKMLSASLIPILYKRCLEDQKRMLRQEAITISLAAFCFSTIKMNVSCVCVTAHFINNDLEFKSVLLTWNEIKGTPTSQNLATILSSTCKDWDILDKVNFCVTDNTENLIEAVNSLGWMHCCCMARQLNLNLQDSLSIFEDILQKVKNLVIYYRSNSKAKEKLMEYQVKTGIEKPLGLINSVPMKWTSTYFMVKRFVHLEDAIKATILNLGVDLPILTDNEWVTLRHLCIVLKPFHEATKELIAEKYTCASKAIAVISGLRDVMGEMKRKSAYFDALNTIECFETQLNANFQNLEYDDSLALCTILDPRYKTSMFMDESAAERTKITLVSKIFNLITAESNINAPTEPESNQSDVNDISLWRRRNAILAKQKVDPTQKLLRQAQQEVELYLQDDFASNDCNPCEWWRSSGQHKYPHLGELYKTSCNLIATVPNERYTLPERKTQLSIKKTEQLVFLNNYFQYCDVTELMS